jgi:eukaryotic-like serine/threonine-protein kinase
MDEAPEQNGEELDPTVISTSDKRPKPKQQMIGKFQIIRELGRGGMGVVYLARDSILEREVAIKTLSSKETEASPMHKELVGRFFREAQAAARLNHINVVGIHEMGTHDGIHYIAMEYAEGETLSQTIRREAPISLQRAIHIISQACTGLHAIHDAGMVHRDIKPSNIMLTADGTAKILDFGIVRSDNSDMTMTRQILGTLNYMSPEQIQSSRNVDLRSDIFSMGAIIYELLTGEKAFPGKSLTSVSWKIVHEQPTMPSNILTILPPRIDKIVERCLTKSPEERYPSCQALADNMNALADSMALPGPADVRLPPLPKPDPEVKTAITRSVQRFQEEVSHSPMMDRHTALSVGLLSIGISDLILTWQFLQKKSLFLNKIIANQNAEERLESLPTKRRGVLITLILHAIGMAGFPLIMIVSWWLVHTGVFNIFASHPYEGLFSGLLYLCTALVTVGGGGFLFLAWGWAKAIEQFKRTISDTMGEEWPQSWQTSAEHIKVFDEVIFKWVLVSSIFNLANLIYVCRLYELHFKAENWADLSQPAQFLQMLLLPLMIVFLTAITFNLIHTVLAFIRGYLFSKNTEIPDVYWNWRFSVCVALWFVATLLITGQKFFNAAQQIF